MDGRPSEDSFRRSMIQVGGGGVEIPTVLFEGGRLVVRLFNAEGGGEERAVSFAVRPSKVELVELDGRVIRPLQVRPAGGGRYEVRLAFPRFGVRTLRCDLASVPGSGA